MINRIGRKVRFPWRMSVALLAGAAMAVCAAGEDATGAEPDALEAAAGQVDAGEHLDAISSAEALIEGIERRSNRYHLPLVAPLLVLGDALAGVGDDEGAFGAYDRALHVTRIGRGLHHPSQVTAVYRQAALHAERGRMRDANHRHEYAYQTLLRNYGADDPALLPGLFTIADWYMTIYNIFSARSLYEQAAAIAADQLPSDDPARVRALRWLAATYRAERFPPYRALERRRRAGSASGSAISATSRAYGGARRPPVNRFSRGERALIEVVNLVQAREDATPSEVAEAMLELGDWFLLFERRPRAFTLYRKVWELLAENRNALASTFSAPAPLYLPLPKSPPRPAHARPDDARAGVVELAIDVDVDGLVAKVETVRAEPGDLMDAKVRRAVRHARYRPAFDGQEPLATTGLRVVHNFTYYPSTLEGAETSARAAGLTSTIAQAR